MNSIVESVKTFISTYDDLKDDSPFYVDYLSSTPTEYCVVPLPSTRILETYIDGSTLREYSFAFQFTELTSDDAVRIESSSFNEDFVEWLDVQTKNNIFPEMPNGMTAERIEAVQNGFLFQQGDSQSAIYQITCRLVYEQVAN